MLRSVKFRITVTACLIILLIMVLSTVKHVRQIEKYLVDDQKEKTVLLSEKISQGVMVLMLNNRWQDLQTFMENLVKDSQELKGVRIFLPESGIVVASSSPEGIGLHIDQKDWGISSTHLYNDAFLVDRNGGEYMSKLTVIGNQPACHKCHGSEKKVLGILGVDISLFNVRNTMKDFRKEYFKETFIAFLILSGGILFTVVVLIDRPIKKMIFTIKSIESGDMSTRMDEEKKDEFGLMAKSFNSMVASVESTKKEIERYHLEQMQRAARLASLGEIISGIAHEIKNPLTGISCAVQLIQSEMKLGDGNREITFEILNQIKRLDRIVKDLLNYAKPKPPRFLPYKIKEALEKALFLVYPEANSGKVTVETHFDYDVSDVMMDPDQMQQVFLNIMINAVQAMPDGGKLMISVNSADNICIDEGVKTLVTSDKVLLVQFRDTGKGIEEECIESIFDPFFTKKTKGTGLGLSISQRIVQEHGGEITVRSEAGKGSIFTVFLPIVQAVKAVS